MNRISMKQVWSGVISRITIPKGIKVEDIATVKAIPTAERTASESLIAAVSSDLEARIIANT